MQKAEGEGDEPRQARGQTGLPTAGIQNLDRNQHDAECYGCLQGRSRNIHKTQRRRCESNAVRDRECRYRDGDAGPASNEDHQRQHKQQVIEAEKNVFDAKAQISRRHFSRAQARPE